MKQSVTIQSVDGKEIKAGCDRSACQGCQCSMFCTNRNSSFAVLNPDNIPLRPGDKAEVILPGKRTVFSVFMCLGLPLIMFLPGYFVASRFTSNELWLLLSALSSVALGFLISGIYFRFTRKSYTPVVSRKEE